MSQETSAMPRETTTTARPIISNPGGHVAHIAVKLDGDDSWNAMTRAAELAHEIGGEVTALYHDRRGGSRMNVLSVEQGGMEIARSVGGAS